MEQGAWYKVAKTIRTIQNENCYRYLRNRTSVSYEIERNKTTRSHNKASDLNQIIIADRRQDVVDFSYFRLKRAEVQGYFRPVWSNRRLEKLPTANDEHAKTD